MRDHACLLFGSQNGSNYTARHQKKHKYDTYWKIMDNYVHSHDLGWTILERHGVPRSLIKILFQHLAVVMFSTKGLSDYHAYFRLFLMWIKPGHCQLSMPPAFCVLSNFSSVTLQHDGRNPRDWKPSYLFKNTPCSTFKNKQKSGNTLHSDFVTTSQKSHTLIFRRQITTHLSAIQKLCESDTYEVEFGSDMILTLSISGLFLSSNEE